LASGTASGSNASDKAARVVASNTKARVLASYTIARIHAPNAAFGFLSKPRYYIFYNEWFEAEPESVSAVTHVVFLFTIVWAGGAGSRWTGYCVRFLFLRVGKERCFCGRKY
jgi:hypothetical protein